MLGRQFRDDVVGNALDVALDTWVRLEWDVPFHLQPLDARLPQHFLFRNEKSAAGRLRQHGESHCDDRPLDTLHRSFLVHES
jgi:hypothetical protein